MAATTSMDILVSITKPVVIAETGELGVEWVAGGRVPNGPDVQISGQVQVNWAWSKTDLRDALRSAARAQIAGAYGLPPITAGRFVLIEAL